LGLKGFRVETAGQSSGPGGHLINMVGIVDTDGFREAVLEQRDALEEHKRLGSAPAAPPQAPAPPPANDELVALARDIRDSLARIEDRLGNGAG
jgi:hypothetical protein